MAEVRPMGTLARLPLELRIKIYKYVLIPRKRKVYLSVGPRQSPSTFYFGHSVRFLLACKAIYREAILVYYGENTFAGLPWDYVALLSDDCSHRLSTANAAMIRHVEIRLYYNHTNNENGLQNCVQALSKHCTDIKTLKIKGGYPCEAFVCRQMDGPHIHIRGDLCWSSGTPEMSKMILLSIAKLMPSLVELKLISLSSRYHCLIADKAVEIVKPGWKTKAQDSC